MSRFYASIHGSRGEATRQGTTKSGIEGHVRGWHVGGRVACYVGDDGEDHVRIELTSGSTYDHQSRWLGDFTHADLTPNSDRTKNPNEAGA